MLIYWTNGYIVVVIGTRHYATFRVTACRNQFNAELSRWSFLIGSRQRLLQTGARNIALWVVYKNRGRKIGLHGAESTRAPDCALVPTFAVRETASLGIMGEPRLPPLNPSESIVL